MASQGRAPEGFLVAPGHFAHGAFQELVGQGFRSFAGGCLVAGPLHRKEGAQERQQSNGGDPAGEHHLN